MKAGTPTSLQFFGLLRWIDGRPLMDTIEPYRRALFRKSLDTYQPDGTPVHNFVLSGRGKKNNKTTDLVLAGLYCLLFRESPQGSDCYILASDEDQAGDDLSLAKKLIETNAALSDDLTILAKEIRRKDSGGTMRVLPAQDIAGAHGKTAVFLGFDEIHTQRNYDIFEALALDPTRSDALTWVTSYDAIHNEPGVPLFDFKALGKSGADPRMVFSWYSGDFCTDPDFADLEPELRANPSMCSWPDGRGYLDGQKRRLPSHKFRRLHLNLPGAVNGAVFDQGMILEAVKEGRRQLAPEPGIRYVAYVDLSGGSNDDATYAIAHRDGTRTIVDLVVSQTGKAPFNPRDAVKKFAAIGKQYGLSVVYGDAYAGQTFRQDFIAAGVNYLVSNQSATEIYEAFEPTLNAGEVELPDIPKLTEQLLTLIQKGAKITHQNGGHDDWANAAAGAVVTCHVAGRRMIRFSQEAIERFKRPAPGTPGWHQRNVYVG